MDDENLENEVFKTLQKRGYSRKTIEAHDEMVKAEEAVFDVLEAAGADSEVFVAYKRANEEFKRLYLKDRFEEILNSPLNIIK